jgi:uroporphyrin-III C-methyltransferase/precorrin-2 dehydrogenase/sirohydrochlorin ferrochelatase
LPSDIDWRGVADPATTTAVYMPTKTLMALVAQGIEHGLDPQTPAVAVARATYPDEVVIRANIAALPERIEATANPGPILVLIGQACAKLDIGSQSTIKRHAMAAG